MNTPGVFSPRLTGMPERVARAFLVYVDMSPRRSLRRLAAATPQIGFAAGKATLERWSQKFNWQSRADEHDRARVHEIQSALRRKYSNQGEFEIGRLRVIQDRYIASALVDPGDPSLTAAQRQRLLNPTFAQFRKALLLEKMIIGAEAKRPAFRSKVRAPI